MPNDPRDRLGYAIVEHAIGYTQTPHTPRQAWNIHIRQPLITALLGLGVTPADWVVLEPLPTAGRTLVWTGINLPNGLVATTWIQGLTLRLVIPPKVSDTWHGTWIICYNHAVLYWRDGLPWPMADKAELNPTIDLLVSLALTGFTPAQPS